MGVVSVVVFAGILMMLVAPVAVYATASPSGQVDYYTSSGSCTSTWSGATLSDGNVPGFFTNNVGGPPITAVVGTGSICIKVALTDATPDTTYTITATKMTGSLEVKTDSSGNGQNVTLFTSSYDGKCTTDPLKMSPSDPFDLSGNQINHVWVGTGCSGPTTSVPEFPSTGGLLAILAFTVPALLLAKRKLVSV